MKTKNFLVGGLIMLAFSFIACEKDNEELEFDSYGTEDELIDIIDSSESATEDPLIDIFEQKTEDPLIDIFELRTEDSLIDIFETDHPGILKVEDDLID